MKTHICQGGLLRRSGDLKANVRECGTKWRKHGNLQIRERTSMLWKRPYMIRPLNYLLSDLQTTHPHRENTSVKK